MSARHIQKPTHINLKDGTLGTALLVTLAFDQQPSQSILGDSPNPSYTSPDSTVEAVLTPANSPSLLWGNDLASHGEPKGYVPILLRPESYVDPVGEVEEIFRFRETNIPQDVQSEIDAKFPNQDFNQHAATWFRELIKGRFQDRFESGSQKSTMQALTETFQQFADAVSKPFRSQQPLPISSEEFNALLHVKPVQKWAGLRISCLVQIAQRSLVNMETPAEAKASGQLYTPEEIKNTIQAQGSTKYAAVQKAFKSRVKSLKEAILDDEITKAGWKYYCKKRNISGKAFGSHGDIHKYFYAAQWLISYTSPHLFVQHRNEFADLARILTEWVTQWSNETNNEAASKVSSRLGCLSNALSNLHLTSEDMAACKEVDAYFNI
eukprot:Blabericola_migrator_1__2317@NODE_1646_length_4102_cov_36_304337_g1071_i0_p1_GENE_NODE_1646_length_4102_cov_36_304337_g1071_i0NODE_1646_length_4102_cov_36_304337_g1071_i0_p1_ORF_typecomplete_len380_score49_89HapK/PF11639_8/0_15PepSY_like/PF11396_8/1_4PepSY_like/PF11396_8/7_9e02_NODE_1646_length_4102_cov_36_304337_g1071_i012422381